MKSKKSKLVTNGVASPIPTGRKDCGGRRDRQTPVNRWQGCSPTPMGRKDHGGNDPLEGSELSQHSAFLDTLGRYSAAVAGLSLGVGAGHQESRDRVPRCLRHPMDDTTPFSKPLHGRGHRRVTLAQVFRTQSRSQLLRCGNGKATDALTKHSRPTQRKKRVECRQNNRSTRRQKRR